MRWSFRILQVGETQVRLHITLLLFMLWYGWEGWQFGGRSGAIEEVVFLSLLFLSVLLHEFGHIFAARHYAIPTPEILLTPIGGIARIARMPEKPIQELVVALAGPAVTLLIILAIGLWLNASGHFNQVRTPAFVEGSLLQSLFWTNVILLAFNMIPAFPMDGGRVLRAAMASRLGLLKATQIAARVGQALALGFAYLGIQYSPMLLLIAVFIFFGAEAEFAAIRSRQVGKELTAERLTVFGVQALPPETTIEEAIRYLTTVDQRAFPIVNADGRLLGTLTRDDLLQGVARHGLAAPVTATMQPPVGDLMIPVGFPFEGTLQRLFASGREALPVVDADGRFVGMVTRDHTTDVLLVRPAQFDHARRGQA
jgi:Zn-dependent protease